MKKISNTDLIINPDGSVYHLNLKPEHLSENIITVGDPTRVHRISSFFDNVDFEMNRREFITHVGEYKGKRITVMSTGMGTDNVEIIMTELDALANIDFKTMLPKENHTSLNLIRIGTSGSVQENIEVGSFLVSEYAIGLDTLMSFYNLEMGALEERISRKLQEEIGLPFQPYCVKGSELLIEKFGEGMFKGNTVTAPGFYAPQGRKLRLPIKFPHLVDKLTRFHHDNFWLTNFEMETAGYYSMASLLGHEMVSVNAILANRVSDIFADNPNKIIDDLIKTVLDRV
ncbi:MAG: nucleoside phosphorylase [Cyclobacteriaceae bacterium]